MLLRLDGGEPGLVVLGDDVLERPAVVVLGEDLPADAPGEAAPDAFLAVLQRERQALQPDLARTAQGPHGGAQGGDGVFLGEPEFRVEFLADSEVHPGFGLESAGDHGRCLRSAQTRSRTAAMTAARKPMTIHASPVQVHAGYRRTVSKAMIPATCTAPAGFRDMDRTSPGVKPAATKNPAVSRARSSGRRNAVSAGGTGVGCATLWVTGQPFCLGALGMARDGSV